MTTPIRPFRWDLAGYHHLGGLLDGRSRPAPLFLPELVTCAAQVLSRCADGELHFVGRSADSVFDLLSGALAGTSWESRIHLLPYSHRFEPELRHHEVRQLRANLAALGITPYRLARLKRPIVLTDLVAGGSTFAHLYDDLRTWIADEHETWGVIRLKLRFLGITQRVRSSPKTWRWWKDPAWDADLPRKAVTNVSLDRWMWDYFTGEQDKLTRSFRRTRWGDESVGQPAHDDRTLDALAEAVAIVKRGRSREVRESLVRVIVSEPAFQEGWLRSLAGELRH